MNDLATPYMAQSHNEHTSGNLVILFASIGGSYVCSKKIGPTTAIKKKRDLSFMDAKETAVKS